MDHVPKNHESSQFKRSDHVTDNCVVTTHVALIGCDNAASFRC